MVRIEGRMSEPAESGAVKSALRVLQIIELLTQHDSGLTFIELRERLGLPKSSMHALLRTMRERGHLAFDEAERRYRLGVRYWEAGQAFMRGTDLTRLAKPYLEAISQLLGETVQLAILDGLDNVYIAKVDSDQPLRLVSHVGSRLPAHATGLGKVLLAYLDEAELQRRLKRAKLARFTDRTIADKAELIEHLTEVRARGSAFDHGEYTPGVFCTAVPVRDHRDAVVAAMSCSVPEVRVSGEIVERMLDVLLSQARALSEALGSHGPVAEPISLAEARQLVDERAS
jgi:IclR family transcriptional regulator, KDG regulon repressor